MSHCLRGAVLLVVLFVLAIALIERLFPPKLLHAETGATDAPAAPAAAPYDPGFSIATAQWPRTTRTVVVRAEADWLRAETRQTLFRLDGDVDAVLRVHDAHRDVILDLAGHRLGGVQIDGSPDNVAVMNGSLGFVRFEVGGGAPTDLTFRDLEIRRDGNAIEFLHGDRILMERVYAHSEHHYAVWGGQGGPISNWTVRGGRLTSGAEQCPLRFYRWERVRFTGVHVEKLAPRPGGKNHWVSAFRGYNGSKMVVEGCTLRAGGSVWGGSCSGGADTETRADHVHLVGNTIENRETISACVRFINGTGNRVIDNAFVSPVPRAYEQRLQSDFVARGNTLNGEPID